MVESHKFGILKTGFLWSALKSFITFVCFQHVHRERVHYLTSAKQQELAVILLWREPFEMNGISLEQLLQALL